MKPKDAVAIQPAAFCPPAACRRKAPPRAERRTPYRVPCRVRLVDTATGDVRTVSGETLDISPSGMSLQIGVEVPVGIWVETLVAHPNGDPMFICGRVVRSQQTMAAHFEIVS